MGDSGHCPWFKRSINLMMVHIRIKGLSMAKVYETYPTFGKSRVRKITFAIPTELAFNSEIP